MNQAQYQLLLEIEKLLEKQGHDFSNGYPSVEFFSDGSGTINLKGKKLHYLNPDYDTEENLNKIIKKIRNTPIFN